MFGRVPITVVYLSPLEFNFSDGHICNQSVVHVVTEEGTLQEGGFESRRGKTAVLLGNMCVISICRLETVSIFSQLSSPLSYSLITLYARSSLDGCVTDGHYT